jgi:ribosomal protein L37AE/L43A
MKTFKQFITEVRKDMDCPTCGVPGIFDRATVEKDGKKVYKWTCRNCAHSKYSRGPLQKTLDKKKEKDARLAAIAKEFGIKWNWDDKE